jgi:two-component system CheB/CheR fusion protein
MCNARGAGQDNKMARKKKNIGKRTGQPSLEAVPTDMAEADAAIETAPENCFPVVGIGASAGGLAAFEAFFSAMSPADKINMAFVLVQHLAPDHKSILSDLVKRYTRMQVFEVTEGMAVKPNCVYIIPPNCDMALLNGTLQLLEPSAPRGLRLPIDFFFRSLAQDQRERAICIVLSGTGSDGTLGVRAIKGEGGMVMVQSPDSSEYDGMPRSAIATGMVDYVLSLAEMPVQLTAYVTHAFRKKVRPSYVSANQSGDTLKKICILLRSQTGHDFSQYKENTVARRIERRMAIHQLDRTEEYLRYMQQNRTEVEALFLDLLIGVTNFFRDPDAFTIMQTQIIPRLFADKSTGESVRVWVCACSTGEEAYSIAILIQEHLASLKRECKVQIFATDIDKQSIEHARRGVFSASIAADVSPERLARYFVHDTGGGSYRVQKAIRDMVVFSAQDMIKDPPFSKLDLISCRNLLIYLNGDLQKKIIPLFHYALNPAGVLFLGPSESVGEAANIFTTLDRKWKLYLRKAEVAGATRQMPSIFIPPLTKQGDKLRLRRDKSSDDKKPDLREVTEQNLLQHYAQAGVLVNGSGDILHIYGRTGKYLEPAAGDAGVNILRMAREGLQRELASALHKIAANREAVHYQKLRVKTNGDTITVNLTVKPALTISGGTVATNMFLVILEEIVPTELEPQEKAAATIATDTDGRIAMLEQELSAKEEYLQTTLEEMETANEELKSTNEELQSVNEEMQSTNEELETSKEELQSVNEELATVNAELQNRVADLSRMNNDMNNFMSGTGIATLFVDNQLRIARFTPATAQLINLIPGDVGRPVKHIVSNLIDYDHLVEDVQRVLDSLLPCEAEVKSKTGAWYLMRIRPYRTTENIIEGAVITFVDITQLKQVEAALRGKESRLRLLFEGSLIGMGYWGAHGEVLDANDTYLAIIGHSREELRRGTINWQSITPPEYNEIDRRAMSDVIANGRCAPYEKEYQRPDGTRVPVIIGGMLLQPEPLLGVAYALDITDRKRAEKERENLIEQLAQAQKMELVGQLAGGIAHDFNNMLEVILGNTELALEQVDAAHPISSDLMEIQKAARHSSDLTRQLLAFARKQPIAPKALALNQALTDLCKMLKRLIGEDIELSYIPTADLWSVQLDPTQLDQILTNLCINARDAIAGVGKIVIETRNISFAEADATAWEDKTGEYVLLSVSDNGCGMDKETLSHIFEPFFTTKSFGCGTGMGLATLYGIVKQNEGLIHVYSKPKLGTTFKIYLPRASEAATKVKTAIAAEVPRAQGETVLLVEDEISVLNLCQSMLQHLGYTVFAADSPGAAMRQMEEHTGEIHLLITDVIMPEMNGRNLAERIRASKPDMKCLFMSGYPDNVIVDCGVLEQGVHFIEKPFSINELACKMREVLET